VVGEVREYDELAGIYEKLDTVRIPTSHVIMRTVTLASLTVHADYPGRLSYWFYLPVLLHLSFSLSLKLELLKCIGDRRSLFCFFSSTASRFWNLTLLEPESHSTCTCSNHYKP